MAQEQLSASSEPVPITGSGESPDRGVRSTALAGILTSIAETSSELDLVESLAFGLGELFDATAVAVTLRLDSGIFSAGWPDSVGQPPQTGPPPTHGVSIEIPLGSGDLRLWIDSCDEPPTTDNAALKLIGASLQGVVARLHREGQRRSRAEFLLEFSRLLDQEVQTGAICDVVTTALERYYPGTRVSTVLATQERETQEPRSLAKLTPRSYTTILDRLRETDASTLTLEDWSPNRVIHAVALRSNHGFLGAIILAHPNHWSLSESDISLLESVALQCSSALNRSFLFAVAEQHIADLSLLQRLGSSIATQPNVNDTFDFLARELRKVFEYTAAVIFFADENDTYLEAVAVWGDIPEGRVGYRIPIDASLSGKAYRDREALMRAYALRDPDAYGKSTAGWQSVIYVPLMSAGVAYGTMLIGHIRPEVFTTRDLHLASLIANQTANVIYQAHINERFSTLYRASVEALAAAVDAKDAYTHAHSRRVASLARSIAIKMDLRNDEVERIELAGLLHDIGKIGIPDSILTKPGSLDTEERLIMMSHSTLGAKILDSHPALSPLVPLVRHHHEWHDGRGYPDGKKLDEIPLGAAILGVADALETMTSTRAYRETMPVEQARQELRRGSGAQFQPEVVEATLELLDQDPYLLTRAAPERSPTRGITAIDPIRATDVVRLRVLTRIAEEIGQLTDLRAFIEHVQQIIRSELDCDEARIWLLTSDPVPQLTAISAEHESHPPAVDVEQLLVGDVVIPSSMESLEVEATAEINGPGSLMLVPLVVEDTVIGLIELSSGRPDQFGRNEIETLKAVAGQVGPTIRVAQMHDDAKRAAMTDGLTGVLNHRAFYQALDAAIERLNYTNSLHLLIVDVIDLKAINDNYGHIAGDRALKAVANALESRVRAEDLLARYGGDEFAIIVSSPVAGGVPAIVERIEQPVTLEIDAQTLLEVRLRCGHATTRPGIERSTELVARADSTLYDRTSPTERSRSWSVPANDLEGRRC